MRAGLLFKITYEFLNRRALKFQHCIKIASFNVWIRYFVCNFKVTLWNSTQTIFLIHCNVCILCTSENLRTIKFKSSLAFLKRPRVSNKWLVLFAEWLINTVRVHLHEFCVSCKSPWNSVTGANFACFSRHQRVTCTNFCHVQRDRESI